MGLAGATINLRRNKSRCAASNAFTMLSNLSRSIVLEAIIRCTSTTFFTGGIRLLESWHLANFPQFGLQKTNSKHYATPKLSFLKLTLSYSLGSKDLYVENSQSRCIKAQQRAFSSPSSVEIRFTLTWSRSCCAVIGPF